MTLKWLVYARQKLTHAWQCIPWFIDTYIAPEAIDGRDEDKTMHDRPGYTQEQVRWLAHALWEMDGCPDDNSKHYWFKAQRMLEAEREPDPKLAQLLSIARQQ